MERLPNELWASVFAFFDLSDLTIVSQVAAHWRAVAFDQPLFWRDIIVQSPTPEILYWASRKVAASLQRKVMLEVIITDEHAPVVDEIFDYVEVTLSRCDSLRLVLPRNYWARLANILVQPAPALEQFRLKLLGSNDDGIEGPSLPADLFHASSTNLRQVHLHGVALPSTSAPAFQYVDTVILSVPEACWQEFDLRLFDIFPSTRALTLSGGGLKVVQPLPDRVVDAFRRLDFLYVQYYETENLVVFSQLPSAVIPEVSVVHSDIGTVYAALDQFSGPIRLAIVDLSQSIHVTFSSTETWIWRTFEETHSDFTPGSYNAAAILADPMILERVCQLRVSLSLWNIAAPFIPPNNVIAELMLYIDSTSAAFVALPTLAPKCPALQTLVLQASDDCVSVASNDTSPKRIYTPEIYSESQLSRSSRSSQSTQQVKHARLLKQTLRSFPDLTWAMRWRSLDHPIRLFCLLFPGYMPSEPRCTEVTGSSLCVSYRLNHGVQDELYRYLYKI